MYRVLFYFIIGILVLTGCGGVDHKILKKSWWKYGSGYHIGGRLTFTNNNLRGDTIYFENKPIALITFCGKGAFRSSAILEIEDLRTRKSGTYHQK